MPRRILSAVLLCALAFVPACTSSSTHPGQLDHDKVKAALEVYDFWRARVDAIAVLALGPNPDPKDVAEYNRRVWYLDVARQVLVIMGAPVPDVASKPKMVAVTNAKVNQ